MAAPEYVPLSPTQTVRRYGSPDFVPPRWQSERPGDLDGRQPAGPGLGVQGPDQGFALHLAKQFRDRLQLQPGEQADDALRGAVGIACRRASLYGRAPMVHDLTLALTIWGFLDPSPPAELVALRRPRFEGVGHAQHHYQELLALVDGVPESTLRMSHAAVAQAYPARWQELVGE